MPADLNPILDTWDLSFRDWGANAVGPDDSLYYRLTRWDDTAEGSNVIQPAALRYRGRVWVLIGAANSSATFQFALAVKRSGVATLVGQPTGGNRRGINGGAFFFVRLPRPGFEVDLPLVAGIPLTDEPDAGVVPDILVTPTLADVVSGADSELRAVRDQQLPSRRFVDMAYPACWWAGADGVVEAALAEYFGGTLSAGRPSNDLEPTKSLRGSAAHCSLVMPHAVRRWLSGSAMRSGRR